MRTLFIIGLAALFSAPTPVRAEVRTDCKVSGTATLVPSSAELRQENRLADACGLTRIDTAQRLKWFIAEGRLVPVEVRGFEIDPELGEEDPDDAESYAFARPWVVRFLEDIAQAGASALPTLRITSLVRPEDYQQRLRRHNGYAARESTHATGATVDLSIASLDWKQRNWLRKHLLALERAGLVEATEERDNLCVHVFVHPSFGAAEDGR